MNLLDGLGESLQSQGTALRQTISDHALDIRSSIDEVNLNIASNSRRNIWGRATFQFTTATEVIGAPNGPSIPFRVTPLVVPKNEAWLLRSFPYAATAEAFLTVETSNRQILWIAGTNGASASISGNSMALAGEELIIGIGTMKAGTAWGSLIYERVILDTYQMPTQLGPKAERIASRNTHDPARDVIKSPGPWEETPQEVANTDGQPPLVFGNDPTAV